MQKHSVSKMRANNEGNESLIPISQPNQFSNHESQGPLDVSDPQLSCCAFGLGQRLRWKKTQEQSETNPHSQPATQKNPAEDEDQSQRLAIFNEMMISWKNKNADWKSQVPEDVRKESKDQTRKSQEKKWNSRVKPEVYQRISENILEREKKNFNQKYQEMLKKGQNVSYKDLLNTCNLIKRFFDKYGAKNIYKVTVFEYLKKMLPTKQAIRCFQLLLTLTAYLHEIEGTEFVKGTILHMEKAYHQKVVKFLEKNEADQ